MSSSLISMDSNPYTMQYQADLVIPYDQIQPFSEL